MEYFRFTLFNNITLLMIVFTLAMVAARSRRVLRSNWPLAYYAVIAGYTFGFDGSYNKLWLAAGVACGLLIRFGPAAARWPEVVFFAYVMWRSVGLLLMW